MNTAVTLRNVALNAAFVALAGWVVSCADNGGSQPRTRFGEDGPPSKPLDKSNQTNQKTSTDDPEEAHKSQDAKKEEPKKKKGKSGYERVDGSGGGATIEFPQFRFNGGGIGPCGGKNYPVVMNVTTTYSSGSLEVKKENGRVICSDKYFKDGYPDGECEKRANSPEKLAHRNVTNTFVRLSKEELKQARDDGEDIVSYAVFAKEVRVSDGRNFTFSKPLPVGIVPASEGRYKGVSTKSWTATVSGSGNFEVTIEIGLDSLGDGEARFHMNSTIPSAGANWAVYDNWVLPTEATYVIDTEESTITSISSKSKQSGGGDKCQQFEESQMNLKLCEKIQGGNTTQGGCTFGQNPYP